jgi:tol-pal system protein YbgF
MTMANVKQDIGESRRGARGEPVGTDGVSRANGLPVRVVLALMLAPLGLGSTGMVACASAPRPVPAVELERTALDLRAKNSGYVRRIEELENRIFILEDQLDSRKLAAERQGPATLPVHVLRAVSEPHPKVSALAAAPKESSSGVPTQDDGAFDGPFVETTIVAEHAVDYTGDAARPDPVSGSSRKGASRRPFLRASAPEPLSDPAAAASGRSAPESLKVYRDALESLRAGHPEVAIRGFRRFLDGNPQHDYADNAEYWIGECYYTERQFRAAERAFRRVVERYPRGNKVPDAMLKMGFTLQQLGDDPGGRAVLESVTRAFPKHDAARLASERLAHPELDGDPSPAIAPPFREGILGTNLADIPSPLEGSRVSGATK